MLRNSVTESGCTLITALQFPRFFEEEKNHGLHVACSIIAVRKEVDAMGGQVIATRGGMIHLVLQLCRQFEDAFGKAIDGGKGGALLL